MTRGEWDKEFLLGAKKIREQLFNKDEETLLAMPIDDLIRMKLLYDYICKLEEGKDASS